MPSSLQQQPLHLAIIMDGNGRWAAARSLPRFIGHRAGVAAARRIITAAAELGVSTLTLYAFSSGNWQRPPAEVRSLLTLLADFLVRETARCIAQSVRLSVIGRRDRLPPALVERIVRAESATSQGAALHLRVAVDYSGREAIAAGQVGPDVDMLIRTGGEHRLSDFLLWESAYAELYFTPCMWPAFDRPHLQAALDEFRRRDRRFGALGQSGLGQLWNHAEAGNIHHIRGDRWLR